MASSLVGVVLSSAVVVVVVGAVVVGTAVVVVGAVVVGAVVVVEDATTCSWPISPRSANCEAVSVSEGSGPELDREESPTIASTKRTPVIIGWALTFVKNRPPLVDLAGLPVCRPCGRTPLSIKPGDTAAGWVIDRGGGGDEV